VLLAALYEWWRDPARAADDPARWVLSCAVLTRPAAGSVEALAERMPVVLSPDVVEEWLDPTSEGTTELLAAVAAQAEDVVEELAVDEVGPGVDGGAPDTAELARPV
jgi:putative SOS response-associated peptidase YedK